MTQNTDDLIYALATPWGQSALAVVRTSGDGSVEAVASIFSGEKAVLESSGYTLHHGILRFPGTGEPVDEVMLAAYRGPKSYTGQDGVEIYCHGSLPGISRIFDVLKSLGFRQAEGGEFTLRAFLSGRMDLTRAEAVHDIVTAKTRAAHEMALNRLSGSVFRRIDDVKKRLVEILSSIELQLDYPEDEAGAFDFPVAALLGAEKALERLAAGYGTGKIFQEGVSVAIAGRTNAGKSSLFNLFLREDRSIVSEVHGTTRDYIESWISIGGIPVRLYDTAGLRTADSEVEEEGIRRSRTVIENAGILIYVVDGTRGIGEEDSEYLLTRNGRTDGKRAVLVWNKADLAVKAPPEGFIPVSAVTGEGFDALEKEIMSCLLADAVPGSGEAVIDSERQKNLLDRALSSISLVRGGVHDRMPLDMIALDLKSAVDALGEITGEVTSEDVLNAMFSKFCVGK